MTKLYEWVNYASVDEDGTITLWDLKPKPNEGYPHHYRRFAKSQVLARKCAAPVENWQKAIIYVRPGSDDVPAILSGLLETMYGSAQCT